MFSVPENIKSRKLILSVAGPLGIFFTALADGLITQEEFLAFAGAVSVAIASYNAANAKVAQSAVQADINKQVISENPPPPHE